METPEQYTVKTPELPEKIYPVNYAGFWDFSLDGCYDASPLNEMDFPNAGEIAAEVSKRYNGYSELIKENERLKGTIGVECVKQLLEAREANVEMLKMLTEVIQFDYNHLLSERVSSLTADLSEKIKSVITKYSKP